LTPGTLESWNPAVSESSNPETLSLCMIVKNEEADIEQALLSVKTVVDEMIVVDTGSTDRTKDISKALGAKVYDFQWNNNFADARNFSIEKASCKWIIILDADEVISPHDHNTLINLLKNAGSKPVAYSFRRRNYVIHENTTGWTANDSQYMNEEAGTGWFQDDVVRLFPNNSKFRFEYPVHERIEPSLIRDRIDIRGSDILLHHYGKLNEEKSKLKAENYYELGKRKLAESGTQNIMAIYELAVQGAELGRYEETVEYLKKVIAIKPDFAKAYHSMGNAYFNLGRHDDALLSYKKARELNSDLRDTVFMYATCLVYTGNAEASIPVLEGLLQNDPAYPQAMLLLAESYFCAGRKDKGLENTKNLKEKHIDYEDYFIKLAKTFISRQMLDYAISLLEAVSESEKAPNEAEILLKECYNKQKSSEKGQ
jgi:O-antigen biosynthesis protein